MLEPVHDIMIVEPTGVPAADDALLAEIRLYLGQQEIVNTILLSGFLARDRFDADEPVLVARIDRDMAAVASLTPGFSLLLSHGGPNAMPVLAAGAIERELAMPGVLGPVDGARAFAEAWAAHTGRTYHPGMTQHILAARTVRMPSNVDGSWRTVGTGDRPTLVSWFTAFALEVDQVPAEEARRRASRMADGLGQPNGALLWIDDRGVPVSVACYKAPTTNGIRIGPVYTPPEHRRRGYGGAVTAAATQLLLDRGYAFACLYTNAANATANHVYQSIGYEFVADSMLYRFERES